MKCEVVGVQDADDGQEEFGFWGMSNDTIYSQMGLLTERQKRMGVKVNTEDIV